MSTTKIIVINGTEVTLHIHTIDGDIVDVFAIQDGYEIAHGESEEAVIADLEYTL